MKQDLKEATSKELVQLKGIEKSYQVGSSKFTALKDVNIAINQGEFVALVGPSGCGKSTILRMIAGLIFPTLGEVQYRNQIVSEPNKFVSIVFQSFALFPWLTVQENVEVALQARKFKKKDAEEKALKLLDMVGLDGFESAFPRELSGGMKQKVGFARAMAVEPELLCLDEPFSALDVLAAESLRAELMELWLNRSIPIKAILMVTHNLEEAVTMADRIIVLGKDPGRVISDFAVNLPHPRYRKDFEVQNLVDKVYGTISYHQTQSVGGLPNTETRRKKLPNAMIDELPALVNKIIQYGRRTDLYRIAEDFGLSLDDLLPIIEVAETLGFAFVTSGDINLTRTGLTYAKANILQRKEILAIQILGQPMIAWINQCLLNEESQRLQKDFFIEELSKDFGDYAEEQLDIAINWARHAELFSFDDSTWELYLGEG